MKCPSCSKNHQYKYGMKCRCGYHFALNPKTDGISDRRFVAFINGASCNGTYSFTVNQLYTAACRKQLASPPFAAFAVVFAILFAVTAILLVFTQAPIFLIFTFGSLVVTLFGTSIWIWYRFFKQLPVSQFAGWLKKYTSSHGPIKGMVKAAKLTKPPPKATESDIYDYGVERVLIVQRPILVDLLVANNIHLTNRSVIVTADGYPSYLATIVQQLLDNSPTLPVFLLHDADQDGLSWAATQKVRYLTRDRPVIDMGVNPDTAKLIRKLRPLRLKQKQYRIPVDALPMAMLANGIALSMERNIGMEQLLINETSIDTLSSFG